MVDSTAGLGEWATWVQPFATGIFALLGTIAGGTITFLTQRHLSHQARKQEVGETASAFAAEIEAYLAIVDHRDHVQNARMVLHRLGSGENLPLDGFGVDKDEELDAAFPIFRSLHGKLGLLGDSASSVAVFYMRATAVRSSARGAARGEFEHFSPYQKADHLREELALWNHTVELGRKLVPKLRSMSR